MNTWNVQIGINPLSWINDDLPALGGDTPLHTVLREGAEIGYTGFELGNKFPSDPAELKAVLAKYGLACVSGWYSGHLAESTVEVEIERCSTHLEKLRINGCNVVVYGEAAGSIQGQRGIPLSKRPQFTGEAQWAAYAAKLTLFGAHLKIRYDITLAYHHHVGAYVESPRDIDTLMALTDPGCVSLLFDTGHAYYGGAVDPVALLRRHIHRVAHVHCKDVRASVIEQTRNEGLSFLNGVLNGTFTVPGDGDLDFHALINALHEAAYEGWLVVEAEQDPAVAPSYACAKKGYDHLCGIVNQIGTTHVLPPERN